MRDCAYVSDPLTILDADEYLVVVSDAEGDYEIPFDRDEVDLSGGLLTVEIDDVVPLG